MTFAKTHDPDGTPWPVLATFQKVIECRERDVIASRGGNEDCSDLTGPPSVVSRAPARPSASGGLQHKTFGADLALELCFDNLNRLPGMIAHSVSHLSCTSGREPILLAVDYARRAGLIPQE